MKNFLVNFRIDRDYSLIRMYGVTLSFIDKNRVFCGGKKTPYINKK